MTFLLENNFLGNKTGKGFYQKTNQKDEKGENDHQCPEPKNIGV